MMSNDLHCKPCRQLQPLLTASCLRPGFIQLKTTKVGQSGETHFGKQLAACKYLDMSITDG